jgi:hypothetical protein
MRVAERGRERTRDQIVMNTKEMSDDLSGLMRKQEALVAYNSRPGLMGTLFALLGRHPNPAQHTIIMDYFNKVTTYLTPTKKHKAPNNDSPYASPWSFKSPATVAMTTIAAGRTEPAATSTSDWVNSSPFTSGDGTSRDGLEQIIAGHVKKLPLDELQKWCNVIMDHKGWKLGVRDTGKGVERNEGNAGITMEKSAENEGTAVEEANTDDI